MVCHQVVIAIVFCVGDMHWYVIMRKMLLMSLSDGMIVNGLLNFYVLKP